MSNGYEKFNKRVRISGSNNITIGGNPESTIHITSLLEDCFSIKNGNIIEKKTDTSRMYINGYPVEGDSVSFLEHDFIGMNDILIYYAEGCLYFSEKIELETSLQVENLRESNNHLQYPQFYRSVRQLYKISDTSIEVLQPKAPSEDDSQGFIATVLPAVMSMGMMLMMRLSMGSNIVFLLIFGGMMLVSGGITVTNFFKQRKKQKDKKENRLIRYGEYIEKIENKIVAAREKETRLLNQKYPPITELIKNVEDFDARLFERKPSDEDFLVYSLGVGKHDAFSQVSFKRQEYVELEDSLMDIPELLHDKYEYIENMPVVLPLNKANAVSFIGARNKLFQMLKNMIIQISISHYYDDVKMCLFMEGTDIAYLNWVRWLKNFNDETSGKRYIAYSEETSNKLLEILYTILSKRKGQQMGARPHYVVFAYKTERFYAHPIIDYIKNAGDLGFTFVLFEEYPEFVNPDCTSRIFLNENDNKGYIQKTAAGEDVQHFEYAHVPSAKAEYVAKRLSPVYVEETSLESNLVKNISLYELLKIKSASQLDFRSRWEESRIYESMAAPLGLKAGDEVVCLDLHERFHGPHGLVAGTTGSGKSEILQSYILSMATLFHPYEVSFIIIDFKGGGMVNQFKNLPHLNGAITNIDGKQIDRSLKSIKAELLKRQRLFADMEVNHIDDYIRKFKNGETNIPLPHLILIVDEFAELKSEQPEFMKELISAARIGRSLGVHLILATQKPAGVVNEQIWSNSNFKLCLKVQNASDSNEVIKSPLAAEIREPGRAYLQVGNNEIFELFQSGYSGAKVSKNSNDVPPYTISMVSLDGSRMPIYENKKSEGDSDDTQLDELVDALAKYCESAKIEQMENICLPPLEEHIVCSYDLVTCDKDLLSVPIGIFDDPDNHYQGTNYINLIEDNVCIVGSSGAGKTNLLFSIIKGITQLYTPEEVNIYVLDFASLVLSSVKNLCYVSGVITSRDDELLVAFFNNIKEEIENRKIKLSDLGYGSFINYRQAGKTDMPHIVIMLDNAVAFKEMFAEWTDTLIAICRDGQSVGISVIYTSVQVGALGYRANAYFSKNIALNCNDKNLYNSMFERNRLYPDEYPGRYITNINKGVYEAQAFIPFEYDNYANALDAINEFVENVNSKYQTTSISKLRSMPDYITDEYLDEISYEKTANKLLIGIEHITLEVHELNLMKTPVLGILNGNDNEELEYIKYLLMPLIDREDHNIYILDGINRQLNEFAGKSNVYYTNEIDDLKTRIAELYTKFNSERDSMANAKEAKDNKFEVLIINDAEAYMSIDADIRVSGKFTKLCNQIKGMNMLVILAQLPNINMTYSAPIVIRSIKENMDVIIFRELENQNIVDVPARLMMSKKKRAVNDVFYLHGSQIHRVRVPFVEGRED